MLSLAFKPSHALHLLDLCSFARIIHSWLNVINLFLVWRTSESVLHAFAFIFMFSFSNGYLFCFLSFHLSFFRMFILSFIRSFIFILFLHLVWYCSCEFCFSFQQWPSLFWSTFCCFRSICYNSATLFSSQSFRIFAQPHQGCEMLHVCQFKCWF